MRRETRTSYSFAPAAELPRPDGIRERRNGLRADARACGGAARGRGAAQATEPGCGAEPHVSRHEPSAHRDGGNGCIIGGLLPARRSCTFLALSSPYVSLTGGPTSTVNCRHELDPRGSRSGARLLDFDDWGLTPAAAPGGDT